MSITREPGPDGISSSISVQETSRQKIEIGELWRQPDVLRDAVYVLLTGSDFKPETARDDLRAYLSDKQAGQNQEEWEERIGGIREEHKRKYREFRRKRLKKQHLNFQKEGLLNGEAEKEEDLYCFHCTNYLPVVNDEGTVVIPTTFKATQGEQLMTSVHVTLNHVVRPVAAMGKGSSWQDRDLVIVAPWMKIRELNGSPYAFLPQDTWWALGATGEFKLPRGTTIIARDKNEEYREVFEALESKGMEVVYADNPYGEAESLMEERGVKIIPPEDFRGEQIIADKQGSFCGLHLGSLRGEGADCYVLAEGAIESCSDAMTAETIEKFNSQDYPGNTEERYYLLLELFSLGYFEPPGFNGFSATSRRPNLEEVMQELKRADKSSFDSPGVERIYEGLLALAEDKSLTSLPFFSEGELKRRLDKIRDNFKIIPPGLIGAFLILNFEKLGLAE